MGPHPGRRPILTLKGVVKAPPPAPVPSPAKPPTIKPALRPIAIAALAKTRRKAAREAALAWLATAFPAVFGDQTKPLALGAGGQIWPRAKSEGIKRAALDSALKHHTSSFRYLDAIIHDGTRFDLAGQPVELVSPEHRQRALEMKAELDRVQRDRAEARKGLRS